PTRDSVRATMAAARTPRTGPTTRLALAVTLIATALFAPAAKASPGPIHREVLKATQEGGTARGPEAYAALRELWRVWDRADPLHVEEAIAAVANDSATSPPIRVYAELLTAYARRRRGDLDGSLARIEKLGFVGRWIAVGPFDNENKAGFPRAFPPE